MPHMDSQIRLSDDNAAFLEDVRRLYFQRKRVRISMAKLANLCIELGRGGLLKHLNLN
jgi:hypothetical protein